MARLGGLLPLRHNRDFMILWSGEAVSALGSSMSVLVFPLIGYAITRSPALAGLTATAVLLGRVITRLPAGAWVDRWRRGRVLLLANLSGAILYATLATATLTHHLTMTHLVVVGFLTGVSNSFFSPAASAATRTVVPAEQLPAAYSQLEAREHAADLIGPPLGGALYSVARGLPFLVDAISYAISALSITFVKTPLPAPAAPDEPRTIMADIAEGLRFAWDQKVIRSILIWGAAINFSVTLVLVTVTIRLIQAGVHPSAIGLVDSIAAVSALIGAFAAPAIISRARTGLVTIITGSTLALVVVPMAWTTSVPIIGGLFAIGFFLLPANNSGISAYMVSVVPDRLQGRVNAAGGFIAEGIVPIAPVLAGILIGWVGGHTATIVGAVFVAASLIPLLASRSIRNLGRPDSWRASPR